MFPKHLLTFSAIVLFIAIASASPVEEPKLDEEAEGRNPAVMVAMGIIRQAVKWAATHCVKEAAHNCKQHWKHARALTHCAKEFLKRNKGRCVVG